LTKKSASNVTEQKPESEIKPEPAQDVPQEQKQDANVENAVPSIKDILAKVDRSKLKLAEEMGIPLTDLLKWMMHVENTQNAVIQALQKMPTNEGIAQEIHKRMMEGASQVNAQLTGAGAKAGQGGDLGSLVRVLKEVGIGGGGGDSDFFTVIGKNYIAKKLASEDLSDFMAREMWKRIMPDAIAKYEQELQKRAQQQGRTDAGS
jgi:alanyl-tRNA synthetase